MVNCERVDLKGVAPEADEAEGEAKFQQKFTPLPRDQALSQLVLYMLFEKI